MLMGEFLVLVVSAGLTLGQSLPSSSILKRSGSFYGGLIFHTANDARAAPRKVVVDTEVTAGGTCSPHPGWS